VNNEFNKNYAQYYNMLYENKNYSKESDYIEKLIKKFNPKTNSILELGCGTGKHAQILSKKFNIVGIDQSDEMISIAEKNKNENLTFMTSNIKDLNLDRKFDAVISLFHVMSYQTSNEELSAAFNTASKHLNKGGIFIFDFWYGPAVLNDKPSVRIKKIQNNEIEVIRLTQPELLVNDNIVDVNFEIIVKKKKTNVCTNFTELHKMRYLFLPEIDYLFSSANLASVKYLQWMETNKEPNLNSWYVVAIGRKK